MLISSQFWIRLQLKLKLLSTTTHKYVCKYISNWAMHYHLGPIKPAFVGHMAWMWEELS